MDYYINQYFTDDNNSNSSFCFQDRNPFAKTIPCNAFSNNFTLIPNNTKFHQGNRVIFSFFSSGCVCQYLLNAPQLHQTQIIYTNPLVWVSHDGNPLDVSCNIFQHKRQAQTQLLNAKTITHQSHIKLLQFLNRCSEFSDFGSSDPEAAVGKPACLAAVCCSEQKAESRENSSEIEEG